MTTVISEFTGQPVDTWSQAWLEECETRAVLEMPGGRDARNAFLQKVEKIRGKAAADDLQRRVWELYYLRKKRSEAAAESPQMDLLGAA